MEFFYGELAGETISGEYKEVERESLGEKFTRWELETGVLTGADGEEFLLLFQIEAERDPIRITLFEASPGGFSMTMTPEGDLERRRKEIVEGMLCHETKKSGPAHHRLCDDARSALPMLLWCLELSNNGDGLYLCRCRLFAAALLYAFSMVTAIAGLVYAGRPYRRRADADLYPAGGGSFLPFPQAYAALNAAAAHFYSST